jgi:UDP-glucose:(heptosyl)LPS alpha-1,3-glucosyltransferase
MKVGIVLKTFDTQRGGAEVWSVAFVRWLNEHAHEVHVVARKCTDSVRTLGAKVHLVDIRSPWRFAAAAERLLRSLDLDIVHDMGYGWYFDIFHSHVGSPLVYRQRLSEIKSGPQRVGQRLASTLLPGYYRKRALYRRQFSAGSDVTYLALSNMVARDFQSVHQIPAARIKIIHNGVDTDRFTPACDDAARGTFRRSLGIDDDQIALMLVAHDHGLKGVPSLIRTASLLRDQGHGVHVMVVGGSPAKAQLTEIRRRRLENRIHFVGRVGDTVPFYQAADIYVHPTRYDACSLSVLEALAVGLPVITTRCNGAAELVQDAVCGFVVKDHACVWRICQHIRELLNPAVRRAMGDSARQTAAALSLDENFRRIERLYHEMLEKRETRSPGNCPRPTPPSVLSAA